VTLDALGARTRHRCDGCGLLPFAAVGPCLCDLEAALRVRMLRLGGYERVYRFGAPRFREAARERIADRD
jgi:hypothetical protein